MTSPAITAQGTKLAVSDGGSPSSFTDIPGLGAIRGLGGTAANVNDISDLDSEAKEKLMGLPDEGQITAPLNFNPANTVHQALIGYRQAKTRAEFRITTSNSKKAFFYGYVLVCGADFATGDATRGTLTVEVDGKVNWQFS